MWHQSCFNSSSRSRSSSRLHLLQTREAKLTDEQKQAREAKREEKAAWDALSAEEKTKLTTAKAKATREESKQAREEKRAKKAARERPKMKATLRGRAAAGVEDLRRDRALAAARRVRRARAAAAAPRPVRVRGRGAKPTPRVRPRRPGRLRRRGAQGRCRRRLFGPRGRGLRRLARVGFVNTYSPARTSRRRGRNIL